MTMERRKPTLGAAVVPSVAAGTGGTERCAAALLLELVRRGHQITIFTADARGADLRAVAVQGTSTLASHAATWLAC
jgi:hypothetical protein